MSVTGFYPGSLGKLKTEQIIFSQDKAVACLADKPFMSHLSDKPSHGNAPLRRTLRAFDRLLHRPVLHRLGMDALRQVLNEMERFHQEVRLTPPPAKDNMDEQGFLVAAGCRLSADLNEAVIDRLTDTLQQHDQTLAELSRRLSESLQAREQASRLLKQAQSLRCQTVESGEAVGLAVVI